MVHLTRRYRFAAGHRLHSGALTAEENARIYGKCNNPYGHGHNYVLEVTVAGPVDPATGMVIDIGMLDAMVRQEVLEPFDHKYLNLEVECFRNRVPTTENLCEAVFERLRGRLEGKAIATSARLRRVRLEETRSNFFEYERPVENARLDRVEKGSA